MNFTCCYALLPYFWIWCQKIQWKLWNRPRFCRTLNLFSWWCSSLSGYSLRSAVQSQWCIDDISCIVYWVLQIPQLEKLLELWFCYKKFSWSLFTIIIIVLVLIRDHKSNQPHFRHLNIGYSRLWGNWLWIWTFEALKTKSA